MEETVFSKIIRREMPADILCEDENVVAFLDIRPNHPGHTLVVPKNYARNIFDIDAKTWGLLMEAVRRLSPAIRAAVHADGLNIAINNESAAGQVVFHAHVHIIPRFDDDKGYGEGHTTTEISQKKIAEDIRAEIAKL